MRNLLQQKIAVLMGGSSSEREVSLRSGKAVLTALQSKGLDAVSVVLSTDTTEWFEQIRETKADIAFIALHGTYGEDGCIQGMLETMQIPYTGSKTLASSLCMNKRLTKSVLEHHGIKTPKPVLMINGVPQTFPVFVKPVAEGSSVGLHLVKSDAEWRALNIQDLSKWLVEECVTGAEVAAGVLNGEPLPVVEIAPKSGMYDFESKYTKGATDYYCPARLPEEKLNQCMAIAKQAVEILGCEGAPRVDLIVPEHGEPVLLEVNTIPGMTETSLLPKAAAQMGISFKRLCVEILLAVDTGDKA